MIVRQKTKSVDSKTPCNYLTHNIFKDRLCLFVDTNNPILLFLVTCPILSASVSPQGMNEDHLYSPVISGETRLATLFLAWHETKIIDFKFVNKFCYEKSAKTSARPGLEEGISKITFPQK